MSVIDINVVQNVETVTFTTANTGDNITIDNNGNINTIDLAVTTSPITVNVFESFGSDGTLTLDAVNKTGSTILKGSAVYISGAQGSRPKISLALADTNVTTSLAIGIAIADIPNNLDGTVITNGIVTGLNTSAFSEGDKVFLSPTVPGGITKIIPTSPNNVVAIGTIIDAHNTQGKIFVSIQYTSKLDRLVDVAITSPTNNDALVYDSVTGLWKNKLSAIEDRVPVNDANYTISDNGNKLISFTNLTADRSLFLPPSTTANQRIRIADESFKCGGTRRILVIPNGSDVISGGINSVLNFPGAAAYIESNGAGEWIILSTTAIQLSAGVNTLPSYTDNGNGTVTIGNNGVYTMFANADGSGRPKSYAISGGTFTMVDGSLNYIVAKYDSSLATTSVFASTNEADINNFSSIKVFAVYRQGTVLFVRDNDKLGLALSNKLQRNAEQTNNIRVNDGTLLLSESATRIVNVSAGTAWIGGNEIPLATVSSSTANTMFFVFQTSPNVWNTTTFATGGQYNNTQYNDPTTGLQTLSTNRYAVIFVFRSLGQGNKLAYVLGQGNYVLGDAQLAKRPNNLPLVITSQMIPVGRIIIQKNASTATQIDAISSESYAFGGVTDHEALSNLLGGDSLGHFHVTQAEKTLWNSGVSAYISENVQAGTTYTLQNSDNAKQLIFTNSAAITLTVPTGLTSGFNCEVYQEGTGQITVTASGTTLHYTDFVFPISYGQKSLISIGRINNLTETYKVFGELSAI